MSDPPPPYSSVIPIITSLPEGTSPSDPNLSIEINTQTTPTQKTLLFRIKPTPGQTRTPVHICCVVDVSGSMGETATFRNDEGSLESDGLTILDLVVHAIKTVISTMTEVDHLSIVSFSSTAQLELPSTGMNAAGKTKALEKIATLQPQDSTNLWAGLELGWDTVRGQKMAGKIHSVFLFTDGMPNVIPPRGHLPMIKMYMDKHGNGPPCTVNTFGFGYNLDSKLLDEIARTCDGSFVFIPDSSFVGTAFINATANLYTVMAENVNLRLLLPNSESSTGMKLSVKGGHTVLDSNWGKSIRVGNVRFDQSRDFIVTLDNVPTPIQGSDAVEYFTAYLDYTIITHSTTKIPQIELVVKNTDWDATEHDKSVLVHYLRSQFVDCVEQCLQSTGNNADFAMQLQSVQDSIKNDHLNDHDFIKALQLDINGQVVEALTPEFYSRWGKHYLFSLADAHRSQLCNNFKDPGVQSYGGPLFRALRDNFDATFNALPPPKPKKQGTRRGPIQMHMYNSSRGPCFHGHCLVEMADGARKLVQDLVKGDQVRGQNNVVATVACVLKTPLHEGRAELVAFPGGLLITPYHPVYDDKIWKFPVDIHKTVVMPCDAVYSFVLDTHHSIVINGIACVTLGHGVKGDVREHPYFGTELVLHDMKLSGGWDDGLVIGGNVARNPGSGLVSCVEMYRPILQKDNMSIIERNARYMTENKGLVLISCT